MDLFEALGDSVRKEFASRRDALPAAYFYEPVAALRMAEALRGGTGGRTALVFSDARTRDAAGQTTMAALRVAGFAVQECVVADRADGSSPQCDDVTKDALAKEIPAAEVFIAVGSGVINDLTKWLSAEKGVPYAVMATAASMNGYTAANVAPAIKGVKSLFRARAPRVVAAIPRVIEQAPAHLTAAGLGDVIAKPVSTADWIINHRLFGEAFSSAVASIINDVEPKYVDHPQAIAHREPAAIQALFDALVFSGAAMTLQGSSLPASGGEHLISHALDMMAHADGIAHDLHGRQVGVATIFAAELYRRLLAQDAPVFSAVQVPFERAVWGDSADAVRVEHNGKQEVMAKACARLVEPGLWSALRVEIAPVLRSPSAIKTCLREAGAAHRVEDLGIDRARFIKAVKHCAGIRRRFTSMDLAFAGGVLPGAAEEIVEEWLA